MVNVELEQLREKYSKCEKCLELCDSRTQVVFGSGDTNADILLVGEGPGSSEDKQGIPFCGASGQVLQTLLEEIDYNRDDVFITNTVICRPPGNRNPKPAEIANCNERLYKTIQLVNPKVIVTVGNFATKAITGKVGITKLRGIPVEVEIFGNSYTVIPVVHPANLLYNGRNPVVYQQMKNDFLAMKKIIDLKVASGAKGQKRLGEF